MHISTFADLLGYDAKQILAVERRGPLMILVIEKKESDDADQRDVQPALR